MAQPATTAEMRALASQVNSMVHTESLTFKAVEGIISVMMENRIKERNPSYVGYPTDGFTCIMENAFRILEISQQFGDERSTRGAHKGKKNFVDASGEGVVSEEQLFPPHPGGLFGDELNYHSFI